MDFLVDTGVVPDVLLARVVGSRIDPQTGEIYHMDFNPPPEDIVERCVQRSDDTEEKAHVGIEQFKANANAVQAKFVTLIKHVDGNRPKTTVFDDVHSCIDSTFDVGTDACD